MIGPEPPGLELERERQAFFQTFTCERKVATLPRQRRQITQKNDDLFSIVEEAEAREALPQEIHCHYKVALLRGDQAQLVERARHSSHIPLGLKVVEALAV